MNSLAVFLALAGLQSTASISIEDATRQIMQAASAEVYSDISAMLSEMEAARRTKDAMREAEGEMVRELERTGTVVVVPTYGQAVAVKSRLKAAKPLQVEHGNWVRSLSTICKAYRLDTAEREECLIAATRARTAALRKRPTSPLINTSK